MPSTVEEVRCQDRRCRAGPAWESRRPRARMTRSGFSCHCTPKPTTRLEHVRPRRSATPPGEVSLEAGGRGAFDDVGRSSIAPSAAPDFPRHDLARSAAASSRVPAESSRPSPAASCARWTASVMPYSGGFAPCGSKQRTGPDSVHVISRNPCGRGEGPVLSWT